MDLKELKEITIKHSQLEKNIDILDENLKNRWWAKLSIPKDNYFYLEKQDIEMLREYYIKEKEKIENKINNNMK